MTQSIGPPSLAQGTRIAVGFSTSISRFIPACGELSKPSWAIVQLDGSSPLARGTRHYLMRCLTGHRFIPAYAGNSQFPLYRCGQDTVHPRLRGELIIAHNTRTSAIGSSPLTRGTPRSRMTTIICLRFIPAYAGNSLWTMCSWILSSVHPRLRGELLLTRFHLELITGSSPLTRGTHLRNPQSNQPYRFIPAYAGNSRALFFAIFFSPVHPRLRGELAEPDKPSTPFARFIPAYAGNSV